MAFRWSDVVLPIRNLEDMTPLNRQRALRVLTASPLGLADLVDAAAVILLSKEARAALQAADPKALAQLETGLALSASELPNPYQDGQAVVVRDHERPQYAVANAMQDGDTRVSFTFGDGYSRYLSPWDFRVRPDDDPQAE
jgi:hypothetical protein